MTRVLIVAFDGLQPSQVRADLTPNLFNFAQGGVTFARNHPVFPTVTRINVASLVTGRHPGAHGLAGNTVVIRDYDPNNIVEAMEPVLTRVAEETGEVLLVPTLADILHENGEEYVAVGVGTSGNAYVQNPRAEALGGATIHPEFSLPRGLHQQLIERFDPWPDKASPNVPQMKHGAHVLIEYVLAERKPTVALIWFSEPDSSNHKAGVGVRTLQRRSCLSRRTVRTHHWMAGRQWHVGRNRRDSRLGPRVRDHRFGRGHRGRVAQSRISPRRSTRRSVGRSERWISALLCTRSRHRDH